MIELAYAGSFLYDAYMESNFNLYPMRGTVERETRRKAAEAMRVRSVVGALQKAPIVSQVVELVQPPIELDDAPADITIDNM